MRTDNNLTPRATLHAREQHGYRRFIARRQRSNHLHATTMIDRRFKTATNRNYFGEKPEAVKEIGLSRRVGANQEHTLLQSSIQPDKVAPVGEPNMGEPNVLPIHRFRFSANLLVRHHSLASPRNQLFGPLNSISRS